MMSNLQKRIQSQFKTKFSEIRNSHQEHKDVIVGFLAILELVKQGNVLVAQTSRFDDIEIESKQNTVPSYG